MTAFLILPATRGTGSVRRVDLADFGRLFAEVEEPIRMRRPSLSLRRLVSMFVILLLMLGDTVLLARPQNGAAVLFETLRTATLSV